MIIRERPSGIRLFLLLRGSVLPRILPSLALNMLIATMVTISHGDLFRLKITLTPIPFSLIGLALALFLGFRNNAAYDRYWEARKQWGEVVHRSRTLTRQCQSFLAAGHEEPAGPDDLRQVHIRMTHRAIAFAYALKHRLRAIDPAAAAAEIRPHLLPQEALQVAQAHHQPDFLLRCMGRDLAACLQADRIEPCLAASIDETFTALAAAAAACERIRSTPIPFSYTLLLHRTAYLYCFLLPFGLVDEIGFMTPFVVGIVAYTFFGLDALGDEIEEPFGTEPNDLPLDAICRSIEIDLCQALGSTRKPTPLAPVNYCLY
jgi:ion channel-forming bestrophin family protein